MVYFFLKTCFFSCSIKWIFFSSENLFSFLPHLFSFINSHLRSHLLYCQFTCLLKRPTDLPSPTDDSATLSLGPSKNGSKKKDTDDAANLPTTKEMNLFVAVKAFQSDDLTFLLELGWSNGNGREHQIYFRQSISEQPFFCFEDGGGDF